MLAHELLEKGQPIHARHLDIERDHIRHFVGDPVGRDEWIAGRGDDLDLRIGGEHLAQRLAHYGGIVYDEYANLG
jgi:hypothetical protein